MKILIFIEKDYCIVAVAHALNYGYKVNSFKAFKETVADYLDGYGKLCIDDHESECGKYMKEAESITEKYYKH